jgi:hypothetical protein
MPREGLEHSPRSVYRAWITDAPDSVEPETIEWTMLEDCGKRLFDHKQARSGVREGVLELGTFDGCVDRHGNGTEPRTTQEHAHELGPVRAQNGNPLARLHTGPLKRPRRSRGNLRRTPEAPALTIASEQGAVRVPCRLAHQQPW